jgi:hypothetical protein
MAKPRRAAHMEPRRAACFAHVDDGIIRLRPRCYPILLTLPVTRTVVANRELTGPYAPRTSPLPRVNVGDMDGP